MKKLILLILALCLLLSACGLSQPEPESSAVPGSASTAPTGAALRSAASYIPLLNSTVELPSLYNEKLLRPLAGSGVFLLCTDQAEMKRGSHYDAYSVDSEGQLSLLEDRLFNNAYTLEDNRYYFSFDWADNQGTKLITFSDLEAQSGLLYFSDDGSRSLFLIQQQADSSAPPYYPVLLDVESGELVDFLAGSKLKGFSISNIALSPDKSGALLAQEGGALYYCDIDTGALYSLDEISGEPVKACVISGDSLICWNQAGDAAETGTLGEYHFWCIDLESFQRRDMPELESDVDVNTLRFAHIDGFDSTLRKGRMFAGSSYALCTDGGGQAYVLDMAAWSLKALSGYTLPAANISSTGSFDGQRLLLKDSGNNRAYVLNYADCSLVQLNVKSTESLIWFDNDSVLEQPEEGPNFYIYDLS